MRASYLSLLLAGCATATSPNDLTGDAHQTDARPTTDARPITDGAVNHDATPGVDAPTGSCTTPVTGMLATWNFASPSQPGTQASTAATAMATGITAGAVSRSAGLTGTAGAGSINSTNWPSGGLDPTKYYAFTIAPPAGCTLDLTSLSIDTKASASGPASGALATSADSFAATTSVATNAPGTPAVSVSGATGQIEVRVYGYLASMAAGTFRIQNALILNGSLH
jgi:hypothetical protein